jgi:hypothetical protein
MSPAAYPGREKRQRARPRRPGRPNTEVIGCERSPKAIERGRGRPSVRNAPIRRTTSPPYEVLRVLRKEVIQPQVPLRLPCYDLAPITGLTFGIAPSEELGKRLRVLPAFMA